MLIRQYNFVYLQVQVLNDAQIGNNYIDNLMNDMVQLRRAVGYVCDPPLLKVHTNKFRSTIEVE